MTYDPAADIAARYPAWVVRYASLGWGISEAMCHRSRVILLEAGDTSVRKRCSLAHALAHLDLGHGPVSSGFFETRQERTANELAARRLVGIQELATALSWTLSPTEVAADLAVDLPTLSIRFSSLSARERAVLQRTASRSIVAA